MVGLVHRGGNFIEALQRVIGDCRNNRRRQPTALCRLLKFAHNCLAEANCVRQGGWAMLQTFVQTNRQAVSLKGQFAVVRILYDPRFFVVNLFYGAKDLMTRYTFTAAPDIVGAFLMPRIDNLCVRAAICTNHDYILSYGCCGSKWITGFILCKRGFGPAFAGRVMSDIAPVPRESRSYTSPKRARN